jgi:hypothetical protein
MFSINNVRRLAAFALIAVTAVACKESTDPEEDEPEVASMRLAVGASSVTVAENGTVTGGPLRITTADQALTATFLKGDGTPETRVTAAEFRLDVTGGTGITFSRTGPFGGNLKGASAGTVTVNFSLFHLIENHADFGPFPVFVQVQ